MNEEQFLNETITNIEKLGIRTLDKTKLLYDYISAYEDYQKSLNISVKWQLEDLLHRLNEMVFNKKRLSLKAENFQFKEVKEIALIRLKNIRRNEAN